MQRNEQQLANLRDHMGWARTYAIYWLVMCLAVLGGGYVMAELVGLTPDTRGPLLIVLGTIIVVNAVWQAAALTIIRLEEVVLPRTQRH
jgi:hypothetical protein